MTQKCRKNLSFFRHFFFLHLRCLIPAVHPLFRIHTCRFFTLPYTFCEQIFNLPVYGAKIIFCPGCDLIIQFCREPERDLFLRSALCHISTDFLNLQPAVHRDFHRARQEDWRPWQLFAPHLIRLPDSHSDAPVPSQPYRLLRQRSSFSHQ